MVGWLWSSLLRVIARNRPVTLALLSAVAAALLGLAMTAQSTSTGAVSISASSGFILAGISVFLIVLAGAVPGEYEAADRLDFILPVIHHVLELGQTDRITVHWLRRFPARGYEQLTDYYPPQRKRSRGRRFPISHGIVAQCFNTRHAICWSVPSNRSFEEAMIERWSFNDEEIRRLTPDRHSFLAYPLGEEGPYAKAVLYIDSADPATLGGEAGDTAITRILNVFDAQLLHAMKR